MESSEDLILTQTVERISSHNWADEEVSIMIDVRLFLNGHFEKGRLTSTKIWNCILENLSKSLDSCKDLTLSECLSKWDELVHKYYTIRTSKNSDDLRKDWKYFDQLHSILKDKPTPVDLLSNSTSCSENSKKRKSDSETSKSKKNNLTALELKKYELQCAMLLWKQKKWKEEKQLLNRQIEALENLNKGVQDLVNYVKYS